MPTDAIGVSAKLTRSILTHHLQNRPGIQIVGITCQWKSRHVGELELRNIEVQGRPLQDDGMYICAASDYFVGEARKYIGMDISQVTYLKQTIFDAVEQAVRKEKIIRPEKTYRLQRLD